ncbi:Hypothetical predicted protein [Mytilus galloprovincialis]|uniref:TIR domain-containing protein n=1 Tax=Mytilus galloprovincialis TaxID=29158 RepID=A0A8B6GL73_MYTGA|nr:Hypothetical predicted protein [Mytilus galloprovincialis]
MKFVVLQLFLCRFVYNVMSSDKSHHRCNFLKESCICRKDQVTLLFAVDCSRLRIKEIPKLPNIIEELSFMENKIQVIPDQAFYNLTNLLKLDLSNNEIYELKNLSFKGLTNLRSLNLQNNRLDASMANLNIHVLKPLENLISLNIKQNLFGNFQPNLTLLVSLRSLGMDFNSNDTGKISESFYSMKTLRELDLSGLTGNCSVRSLTNESFKYIPQIEHLSLSGCRIKHINKGTFQQLKNISTLNISNNTCLKFEVLENVTYDLQFSAIKVLKFNKIHKVFDMNTMLRTSQIKYLTNTSIKEMHGDSNRLQQIEIGALLFLPKTLDYVSARDNQFSYGPYLWDMLRISLKMFNISHMFTFHREDEHPEKCSYDIVCKKEPATESKMKYSMENSDQTFQATPLPIPHQLTSLNYSSCHLHYSILAYNLTKNNLRNVDLSNNLLTSWIGPIYNVKNLKYLDLSSNFCSNVSNFFFSKDFGRLEELYLQNNILGYSLPYDNKGNILQNLTHLKTINLSQNKIQRLSKDFFKFQLKIERIDLSENTFESIDFDIGHLKCLKYLNLKNNRISYLSASAILQLVYIGNLNHNFKIDLSQNDFLCTCETINFVQWLVSTTVKLIGKKSYTCQLSDLTLVPIENIDEFYDTLSKDCLSKIPIIVALVASVSSVLIIICSGLIYRYRWKLRYAYYMIKIRSHKKMVLVENDDDKSYMYGAFVSYADEDGTFVHKQLLTKLEKEHGILLCLHKRNFLPGNDIATNITSAIHNSRKTIIIMSRNFLKSYWCMFEYNMARMESIYERSHENVLFLIFIDQMKSKELPLHILELVQSQSYIEYPNDEYGDTVFWDQITQVLSS